MSEDLRISFFENILRAYENDSSITLTRIYKKRGCGKGENYMSVVSEVTVLGSKIIEGERKDYHRSVIIKQLPEDKKYIEHLRANVAFQNEVEVYNQVVPAFEKYSKIDLPVPNCIYADPTIIVLENLKLRGFELLPKRSGLNIEQCLSVLKELSKIHAASLVLEEKQPQLFKNLLALLQPVMFHSEQCSPLLCTQRKRIEVAIRIFKSLEKSVGHQETLKILENIERNFYLMQRNLLINPRKYSVLTHGDVWYNNILFRGNDVKLIDLQVMKYTSVAADLSYLIFVNLDPLLLTKHIDNLLDSYLTNLHLNLLENSIDLRKELTMLWLRLEMFDFAPFGFINGIWFMPTFFYDQEELDSSNIMIEKFNDVDYMESTTSSPYKKRLTDFIFEYVKYLSLK